MNEGLRAHYLEFARYNTWANRRTAEMLDAPVPDVLASEQVGLRLFSHLLRAEAVWLGRIRGTADAALPIWETDMLSICRERLETNAAAFGETLFTSTDLSKRVDYANSQGTEYSTAVADIFSHVFNHGTHHRGQILLLLREAGNAPAPLDYIAYVRLRESSI